MGNAFDTARSAVTDTGAKRRLLAAAGLKPTTEQLHPILAARAAKAGAR